METFLIFMTQNFIAVTILLIAILGLIIHESRRGGQRVDPSLATKIINKQDAKLLDLRQEKEFNSGHISGSINCDKTQKIEDKLRDSDKNLPIVLVCQNGASSKQAGINLKKSGFDNIYIIQNGIAGWKAQGLPLVKTS